MTDANTRADTWFVNKVREPGTPAFELLYEQYYKTVYGLALRLSRDAALAEDVTQEVFISVWRGVDNFRGECSLLTWIHTIAVRTATRHMRRQRESQPAAAQLEEYAQTAGDVFPDTRLELERAIASLPDGARAALVLHDIYGYTHSEIGEMLSLAAGTVKAQLHRARNLIKQELRK